jgi:exopolyphosphatase/guanosine-5'-triphosphate,3'-diphosphate pyrophosphatase
MSAASSPVGPANYAAIDLGTNSCLLLIAHWDGSRLTPLTDELRIIRLGDGIDKSGRITDQAMGRALDVLQEYRDLVEAHECRQVRCIATSAFREATNRDQLRQQVQQATDLDIVEISGQEEATLTLRAIQHDFPNPKGNRAIVDVGGGSTEIILERQGTLESLQSLPMGSVRLTERHIQHDPPLLDELDALTQDVKRLLSEAQIAGPVGTMVGVGGTATTFVAMDLQLEEYDSKQVHGSVLPAEVLQRILAQCSELSCHERINLPGLHPGRAEVIIAGGLILRTVMEHFNQQQCLTSDRGLRWGVILDQVLSNT